MLNVEHRHVVRVKDAPYSRDYSLPTMDVDEDTSQNLRGTTKGTLMPVLPVDSNHPFDLEAYSSNYIGTTISKYPRSVIDKR